jgi:hypothetical protein
MPWRAVLLALGVVIKRTHAQSHTTTGELYTFDVNTRTQYLLRNLQAGLPPLEVDEKLLEGPDGAGLDFSVPITGPDGIAYQCFADSEGTKSDKDGGWGPRPCTRVLCSPRTNACFVLCRRDWSQVQGGRKPGQEAVCPAWHVCSAEPGLVELRVVPPQGDQAVPCCAVHQPRAGGERYVAVFIWPALDPPQCR